MLHATCFLARLQSLSGHITLQHKHARYHEHAGGHPVLSMLEAAQPVLTRVVASPALQANATVVSALCEVRWAC